MGRLSRAGKPDLRRIAMDLFQSLDQGTFAFFHYQAGRLAWLRPLFLAIDYLGQYPLVLILGLGGAACFWKHGRTRTALVSVAFFAAGIAVVESLRWLVVRERPDDAARLVSAAEMIHGFPSRSVFLFPMALLLLAHGLERWLPGVKNGLLLYGVGTILTMAMMM